MGEPRHEHHAPAPDRRSARPHRAGAHRVSRTIEVIAAQRAYFDSAYLGMSAVRKVVPRMMLEWFHTADGRSFRDTVTGGVTTTDAAALAALERGPFRRVRLVVGYLAHLNANFLFGTDTPSMPSYGNLPGLNGYLEIRQLRKAGLSLGQIFEAATINNARMLEVDSLIGTIQRGKVANLLLLGASPLQSVDAYDDIRSVWIHGTAIRRESLAASGN